MGALRGLVALALIAVCGCQGRTWPKQTPSRSGSPWSLRVTTSDSAVEKQLAEYFREVKDWVVDFDVYDSDPDDLYLSLSWSTTENGPTMHIKVDVVPSNRSSDDKQITESRVWVSAVFKYGIDAKHAEREPVLEALNAYHDAYWMPERLYLDEDGDLVLESNVNIPGKDFPIHPELVADVVERMAVAWDKLADTLRERWLPMPQNF